LQLLLKECGKLLYNKGDTRPAFWLLVTLQSINLSNKRAYQKVSNNRASVYVLLSVTLELWFVDRGKI